MFPDQPLELHRGQLSNKPIIVSLPVRYKPLCLVYIAYHSAINKYLQMVTEKLPGEVRELRRTVKHNIKCVIKKLHLGCERHRGNGLSFTETRFTINTGDNTRLIDHRTVCFLCSIKGFECGIPTDKAVDLQADQEPSYTRKEADHRRQISLQLQKLHIDAEQIPTGDQVEIVAYEGNNNAI